MAAMSSSSPRLRWGVLGASSRNYNNRLLPAFAESERHEIVAEARRSGDDETPYAELLTRSDVDVVYIPLPNASHAPWILRSLDAGKHVLCEKPLAMTAGDTDACFAAAEAAGRVLLEAYVAPHHPRARLIDELARTELGELRHVSSMFTFPFSRPGDHRVDHRGGGALADLGIYVIAPAMLLAGREPVSISATAVHNELGVDLVMTALIDWGHGFTSGFHLGFDEPHRRFLEIAGTHGVLRLEGDPLSFDGSMHVPGPRVESTVTVSRRDESVQSWTAPGSHAFREMIDHLADVVQDAAAPVFGATESRRLARIMDELRRVGPSRQ